MSDVALAALILATLALVASVAAIITASHAASRHSKRTTNAKRRALELERELERERDRRKQEVDYYQHAIKDIVAIFRRQADEAAGQGPSSSAADPLDQSTEPWPASGHLPRP